MLKDDLIKFGLTDKEADVYLTMLEMGSSLVSDIAKRTALNRSTTYVLLESLSKKGLVSISTEGKIRHYSPAPPDRIIHLLEESLSKYTELLNTAEDILPKLKALTSQMTTGEEKPKVRLYEGAEGIKSVYEDTLTANETIRAYASIENMNLVLPDYFPKYVKKLTKKNLSIRAIFPETKNTEERVLHARQEGQEVNLVPVEKYSLSPEINVYDNKIGFISFRSKFGLIIESAELASALKSIFELSWLGTKMLAEPAKV